MNTSNNLNNQISDYDIAIIGMSCRCPKSKNVDGFWHNLREGINCISNLSDEEIIASGVPSSALKHPNYIKAGGVLENADLFDASFFDLSPKEAEIIDPQHRLFLETSWEALENSGYDSENYTGAIGVYAGCSISTYLLFNLYSNQTLLDSVDRYQAVIGNDKDFLSTRVSHKFNLKGPSINIQTACSTSLVAIHLACQSLINGECDIALAGGSSIRFPQAGYVYHEGMILSPDGICRAFDAKSQGTVGGNGVGVVVLKRLKDALSDGDHIHSVIKGSAINNDGGLKNGYTAPSIDGQEAVISEALEIAGIEADQITYVETHGTGTALGDPIEIAALTQAFRQTTNAKQFCAIGSVKTNIGHLDTASGVIGLIKTVLALQHKLLPPSLHFEKPNPKIDFVNSPFYVNTKLIGWETEQIPRRAGVSSFGIGGTNAHIILEESPSLESSSISRPWHILTLSAKTISALDLATVNLAEHFKQNPALNLADVAYTLQVGRKAFNYRRMLVCSNVEDAINYLEMLTSQQEVTSLQESQERSIVFMFSGQGTQYVNMGLEIYQKEPIFRKQIDLCSKRLKPHLGIDLREVLYPSEDKVEEASYQLKQTYITQPALFVIEYALSELWLNWGVKPTSMIGHSIGEYVAACLAGVFSLDDALKLVVQRGKLMQQLTQGSMLAISLPEQEVRPLLENGISIAVINGVSSCVVSGTNQMIAKLQDRLTQHNIHCRLLNTSHAFHSEMMDPILEEFFQQVNKISLQPPQIPFISNVTGNWITNKEATDPNYWVRHLRQTVRFADGLHHLYQEKNQILIEIGPGHTLSTLAKQHPDKKNNHIVLNSLRHPQEQKSDINFLLITLGQLWQVGTKINWSNFYTYEKRHRVPLPTYPFERQRYWIEQSPLNYGSTSKANASDNKLNLNDWFYVPLWKQSIPSHNKLLNFLVTNQSRPVRRWLFFIDECGLGVHLVNFLKKISEEVIVVKIGDYFCQHQENEYQINPNQKNDYKTLIEELYTRRKIPHNIVHLWSITSNNSDKTILDFSENSHLLGFYSLLFLAQSLGEKGINDSISINVVSNNLQEVTGDENICPEKATILGPCQVIPKEYTNLICRSIDILLPASFDHCEEIHLQKNIINQIVTELLANQSDVIVAYRGQHRWVRTFDPIRLNQAKKETTCLRDKGVYLITGGLGGIGLVLAEYLAQTVQAKLILLGRSALPSRDKWQECLDKHDSQDNVSMKIQKVQYLELLGAEVMLAVADVTNYEQMQIVVNQSLQQFGSIHGIIHTAGIAGGGMIQLKTPEIATSVLSPKVKGTLVIDSVFKHKNLDFLILCSSLNSLKGVFGQVDYCAANCFLDAFAHYKNLQDNTLTISINWDTWQEVGMAVNTEIPANLKKIRDENLKKGISPQDGVEVFSRILCNPLPQLVVSSQNFISHIDEDIVEDNFLLEKIYSNKLVQTIHPRPNLPNVYIAPQNDIEKTIVKIWEEVLGIDGVGIFDNFFDLGGHSLMATQVVSRLRDIFSVDIALQSFFDDQTVAGNATLILQTIKQQEDAEKQQILSELENLSEEEVERKIRELM